MNQYQAGKFQKREHKKYTRFLHIIPTGEILI